MIVYLVRHGETAYNRDGLGLGRADVPLTPQGEQQAAALGRRFAAEPLDLILSSPLDRAAAVARAIAGERAVPVSARHELIEMDVGETEGLPFAVVRERFPTFMAAWAAADSGDAAMPGGESIRDVQRRLGPVVEEIRGASVDALAVVSHNFVIKLLLCDLLGLPPQSFRSFATDLASVSALSIQRGRVTARYLNDCCHLNGLEPSINEA